MNFLYKYRYIIGIVIIAFILYRYWNKAKESIAAVTGGFIGFGSSFRKIKEKYGDEIAQYTEKIARLESNHFRDFKAISSNNYGFMLAFSDNYPYGWTELKSFWDANPQYAPTGVYRASNGFNYLQFRDAEGGLFSVAQKLKLIKESGNHYGYYFSKLPTQANDYLNKLNSIKTQLT